MLKLIKYNMGLRMSNKFCLKYNKCLPYQSITSMLSVILNCNIKYKNPGTHIGLEVEAQKSKVAKPIALMSSKLKWQSYIQKSAETMLSMNPQKQMQTSVPFISLKLQSCLFLSPHTSIPLSIQPCPYFLHLPRAGFKGMWSPVLRSPSC